MKAIAASWLGEVEACPVRKFHCRFQKFQLLQERSSVGVALHQRDYLDAMSSIMQMLSAVIGQCVMNLQQQRQQQLMQRSAAAHERVSSSAAAC